MKRGLRIASAAGIAVALAAAAVATWYVRSGRFEERVRAELRVRLAEATRLDCRIGRLRLELLRGRFEILGLELSAPAGALRPFELSADAIRGRLRLRAVLRGAVDLAALEIVRPRIVLRLGRPDSPGIDPEKVLEAVQRSLAVAAKRVEVRDGILDFDHRRIPLELAIDDFACELEYRRRPRSYRVHLAYRGGRTTLAGHVLTYDLEARAVVDAEGIAIESLDVRREATRLRGSGRMRDWRAPVLALGGEGSVSASDLALFAPLVADARGHVGVKADLGWDARGFHARGTFEAERGSYRGAVIAGLRGGFGVEGGRLRLDDVTGRVGAGRFGGRGLLELGAPAGEPNRFQIEAERIALGALARVAGLPGLELDNTFDARVEVAWRRGLEDLTMKGAARLAPPPGGPRPPDRFTPLAGDVEFAYAGGAWNVARADLRSAATSIEASGRSSTAFHVRLRTGRIGEPLRLLRGFSPKLARQLASAPDLLDAAGHVELDGDVTIGAAGAMAYAGSVRVQEARYRSFGVDALSASARWNGSELALRGLQARRGDERVSGDLVLAVPDPGEPLRQLAFDGVAERVAAGSLAGFGADPGIELAGILSWRGRVELREERWLARGDGRLERGAIGDLKVDALSGALEVDGRRMHILRGEAVRGPARVEFQGAVTLDDRALDLSVRIRSLPLADLSRLEGKDLGSDLGGTISGAATLEGTAANPVARGTFELAGLRFQTWQLGGGSGTFELRDQVVSGTATIRSELGTVGLRARVATTPGYAGRAELEFRDWDLQRVASGAVPPYLRELSSALEGNLAIEGPFGDPGRITATGELDGARFKIHDYELRNAGKIRFSLAGRKVRLEEFRLVGEGTDLTLDGEAPLEVREAFTMKLAGTLNLRFLEHLENRLRVSGTTRLDVRASGSLADPQVVGVATLNNTRFDYGDFPLHLSGMHGNIVFSSNVVRLERIEGMAASGTVRISGTVDHERAELRSVNLQASLARARLAYPRDVRSVVDAELNLRGAAEALVLTGAVSVLRADYVRDFNLLEQLAARSAAPAQPAVTDPRLAGVALNVAIHSDDGLFVDNELTKLRGRMRLTLRGSPAYPSLTGRIEATEGAIYFRGNRFDMIHASADFVDRNRMNPAIDIRAESDVKSYRLLLDVSGNLDNLRFNVSSDPPLSTVDIVSLLTTGKSYEGKESSRRQAEITGLSAASILSESLTGVIGKRVQRLFGFQSFRVDPFLAGAENDPTARVTISERLSKDVTITFSRNLSRSEEQIVILEYDVNRNLSVVATRDEDGKFGLDFRFRKRFR